MQKQEQMSEQSDQFVEFRLIDTNLIMQDKKIRLAQLAQEFFPSVDLNGYTVKLSITKGK